MCLNGCSHKDIAKEIAFIEQHGGQKKEMD
jgi:hypothetical protein